jgi:hypothetical protein
MTDPTFAAWCGAWECLRGGSTVGTAAPGGGSPLSTPGPSCATTPGASRAPSAEWVPSAAADFPSVWASAMSPAASPASSPRPSTAPGGCVPWASLLRGRLGRGGVAARSHAVRPGQDGDADLDVAPAAALPPHAVAALGHQLLQGSVTWAAGAGSEVCDESDRCRPSLSAPLVALLVGMLDPRPSSRLTLQQVVDHPWFAGAGDVPPARAEAPVRTTPVTPAPKAAVAYRVPQGTASSAASSSLPWLPSLPGMVKSRGTESAARLSRALESSGSGSRSRGLSSKARGRHVVAAPVVW